MIHQRLVAHAFEVAAMTALLLSGVVGLIHPQWAADLSGCGYCWYAVLAVGALTVLAAMLWPSALTALQVERIGLVVVAWQLISIGVVVQLYAPLEVRLTGFACLLVAVAASAGWFGSPPTCASCTVPPELDALLRILTSLGALTGAVLVLRAGAEKRKIKAETTRAEIDAAAAMAGTALSLIEPLREEIATCKVETLRLRQEIARHESGPGPPGY